MKMVMIVVAVAIVFTGLFLWNQHQVSGIHGLGKNVALIEGECVVINWDATEVEAEAALRRWQELKK